MVEIKHKITGEIIFTYGGATLRGANLRGATLSDADLRGADLRGADLRYADLRYADLRDDNLRDANLRDADLSGAILRRANLRDADLRYCIGNNNEVKSLQLGTYLISFCGQTLNIGCQSHTIEDWGNFTDKEISDMDSNALDWWKLNKSIILEVVKR